MVGLLIHLLVLVLIAVVIWYVLSLLPLPENIRRVIMVIVAVN